MIVKFLASLKYTISLVVYLPNSEYSSNINQIVFKLSYTKKQRKQLIQNGFEITTGNIFIDDSNFFFFWVVSVVQLWEGNESI